MYNKILFILQFCSKLHCELYTFKVKQIALLLQYMNKVSFFKMLARKINIIYYNENP